MKRLQWASAILAIGTLALPAVPRPASAAPVTFAFVAPVTSGALLRQVASGSISFDDTAIGAITLQDALLPGIDVGMARTTEVLKSQLV